jgi:lysyl oxidase
MEEHAVKNVIAWRLLPVLAAIGAAAAALALAGSASSAGTGPARLPDLVQQTPRDLVLSRAAGQKAPWVLGFRSAVSNVGDGPLIIEGHRPGAEVGTMVANQVVDRGGAPQQVISGVGQMRYVVNPDHRHWHLLGFDRYELRHNGERVAAVRDRKTGFCLGDRYLESEHAIRSARAPQPMYTSRCGLGEPRLLGVEEGISVGYGDNYAANLEGQYLRLTGLPAGRYVLVHQVNADRRLRELDYGNDAASLLLELRWRDGQPMVRVLRQCPGTDRCDRRARSPIRG